MHVEIKVRNMPVNIMEIYVVDIRQVKWKLRWLTRFIGVGSLVYL